MRQNRHYLPAQAMYPAQGLNSNDPSTMMDPKYTPNVLNISFHKGQMRKRQGYSQLGGSLNGTVMAIIEFETASGVIKTVVITTTKMYYLNVGTWTNITLQTAGVDVNWTGGVSDTIDWVVATDNHDTWLFVTNGKDAPRKWNGSTAHFVAHGFDLGGFTTCKCFSVFKSSLVIANLGAGQEKIVAWSDTAEFTSWLTGNADAQLLSDADGQILRVIPLADQMAIYNQNSITMVSFVGGLEVFAIVKVVDNTRLLSGRCIVNVGPFHVYASEENVYYFDGTRQFRPLGDLVQDQYRADLLISDAHLAFSFYNGIETTVMIAVPTANSRIIVYTMELSLLDFFFPQHIRWSRYQYVNDPTTIAYLVRDTTLQWNSTTISTLTWNNATFPWVDNSIKQGFPELVFGSGSKIYTNDATTFDDAGSIASTFIDTIDFTVPQEYVSSNGRWSEVEIELRGSACHVSYSTDQGLSWTEFNPNNVDYRPLPGFALSAGWQLYKLYLDVTSRYLRVRVWTNSSGQWFERRFLRVWVSPTGAW